MRSITRSPFSAYAGAFRWWTAALVASKTRSMPSCSSTAARPSIEVGIPCALARAIPGDSASIPAKRAISSRSDQGLLEQIASDVFRADDRDACHPHALAGAQLADDLARHGGNGQVVASHEQQLISGLDELLGLFRLAAPTPMGRDAARHASRTRATESRYRWDSKSPRAPRLIERSIGPTTTPVEPVDRRDLVDVLDRFGGLDHREADDRLRGEALVVAVLEAVAGSPQRTSCASVGGYLHAATNSAAWAGVLTNGQSTPAAPMSRNRPISPSFQPEQADDRRSGRSGSGLEHRADADRRMARMLRVDRRRTRSPRRRRYP